MDDKNIAPENSQSDTPTQQLNKQNTSTSTIITPNSQTITNSERTSTIATATLNTPDSSQNTLPSKQPPKSRKLIYLILIILLILLAGLVFLYLSHKSTNTKTNTYKLTNTNKYISSAPSSGPIKISYVTINTGVDESKRKPSSLGNEIKNKDQFFPSYVTNGNSWPDQNPQSIVDDTASTSSGHYVYIDTTGYKTISNNPFSILGGKVIYDGNVLYKGDDIVPYSEIISQNGLHNAYVREDNNKFNIYVDNKLSNIKYNGNYPLLAISNDGKKIAYANTDDNNNDNIYINNNKVLTIYQFSDFAFSSDLSHFIFTGSSIQNNDGTGDGNTLVNIDGRTVYAGISNEFVQNVALSQNGKHSTYLVTPLTSQQNGQSVNNTNCTNCKLVIDGKSSLINYSPIELGINDNGHYYYIDGTQTYVNKTLSTNGSVHIDNNIYKINSNYLDNLGLLNLIKSSNNQLSVDSNGGHYFIDNPTTNIYLLDGKTVNLTGDIFKSEFSNNTLFIYRFSN